MKARKFLDLMIWPIAVNIVGLALFFFLGKLICSQEKEIAPFFSTKSFRLLISGLAILTIALPIIAKDDAYKIPRAALNMFFAANVFAGFLGIMEKTIFWAYFFLAAITLLLFFTIVRSEKIAENEERELRELRVLKIIITTDRMKEKIIVLIIQSILFWIGATAVVFL